MSKNINARQAVTYTGNVYIRYQYADKIKRIRVHNEGKIDLFTAIALALGDRTAEAKTYMPKYLMAKTEADEDCFTNKSIVQDRKYYYLGSPSSGEPSDTIRYTFIIPVSNLKQDKIIKTVQLLNEQNGVCAEITLSEGNTINTSIAASLLIYWDLTFKDGDVVE